MKRKDYLDFIEKTHVAQSNLDTLLLLTNRINELGGLVNVDIDHNGSYFRIMNHHNTNNELVKAFTIYKYREDEGFEEAYDTLCKVYEEVSKEEEY